MKSPKNNVIQTVFNINIDTPYVTVAECSRRIKISERTTYRYIKQGLILVYKNPDQGEQAGLLVNLLDLYARAAEQSVTVRELLSRGRNHE